MDPIAAKLMSAAGAAADPVYVDDVFSIDLWTGTGSAQSITNGIDISGEGGMIWTKSRTSGLDHYLSGPDIGTNSVVRPNSDAAKDTSYTSSFTAFNNNGFSLGTSGIVNNSSTDYVGWTFRKCRGFFDVVTYTGNGSSSGQTISHSLGSAPGSIWIKRTSAAEDWCVYHRSVGTAGHVRLNKSAVYTTNQKFANVTSTSFDVYDSDVMINGSGDTYVAYIFAHDDQSFGENRDQAIIKCGSTSGSSADREIDLGFEPQLLILKKSSSSGENWGIYDTMRGLTTGNDAYLSPNLYNAETLNFSFPEPRSNGFALTGAGANNTYIYIAIRRPMKTTDDADEVLDIKKVTGNGTEGRHIQGSSGASVTDMFITRRVNESGEAAVIGSRFQGNNTFQTNSTDGESNSPMGQNVPNPYDVMTGVKVGNDQTLNGSGKTYMHYFFSRKPEIYDTILYDGSGSARTVSHNLSIKPEVAIIKRRDTTGWHAFGSTVFPQGGHMYLNEASAIASTNQTGRFVYSNWSSTALGIGTNADVNASSGTYIAHLFASKAGVCKIGTYSGNGSSVDVDCGFAARFVMIKRMDVSGNWWIMDTVHGVNGGNDPGWNFNNNNTGTAQYDLIDADSDGFTAEAGRFAINQSGGTYFFMAFA